MCFLFFQISILIGVSIVLYMLFNRDFKMGSAPAYHHSPKAKAKATWRLES